jgi:hypothetical protein
MVASVLTFVMAAALAQEQSELTWLKSVPSDVEIVARVKGLEATKDDAVAMLQAMSPALADQAKAFLEAAVTQFAGQYGKVASESPFLVLMRLPKPDAAGSVPYAVIVRSDNYEDVQKSLVGGGDVKSASKPGGYDAIDAPEGKKIFIYKGKGFVAFSEDEDMLSSIVKPKSTLDAALPAEIRASLMGGDLGLYVNLAEIQSRYGEQIDALKQQFLGALDQAPVGGATTKESIKSMYGSFFDSIKLASAFAVNFDFAPEGLTVNGHTTVKPDTDAAKRLAKSEPGTGAMVGRLPGDAFTYIDLKVSPDSLPDLQKMGLSLLLGQAGKASPEMQKAMDLGREAGTKETATASSAGGARSVTLTTPDDPRKAVEASIATFKAMASGQGFGELIKGVKVAEKTQSYKGFTLNKADVTFDLDKTAALQPNNPGAAEALRKMLGGDSVTSWFGTDGKQVISVTGKAWDEAKVQIDKVLSGEGTLSQAVAYAALRSKLPAKVSGLLVVSAQGLVRQISDQLAATMPGAELPKPADMPKETAFLGGSVTASPSGYQLRLVVPSPVGTVLEKGLTPVFQGLQGKVGQ